MASLMIFQAHYEKSLSGFVLVQTAYNYDNIYIRNNYLFIHSVLLWVLPDAQADWCLNVYPESLFLQVYTSSLLV